MGLHPSDTKSCERRACPHPSGTLKLVGETSSVRYEVARKEVLSLSIRYVEPSRRDFVYLVHSHANEQLDLVRLVRGLKHAGLCTSRTKSREWRACPRARNKAGGTSSVRSLSKGVLVLVLIRVVREIMQAGLHLSGTKLRKRRACPCPSNIRNHIGKTLSVWYEVTQKESLSSSV